MNAAEKLLATAAVTISKSQSDVQIQCSNSDDANTIFEWLTELAERLAKKNAATQGQFAIGDTVMIISGNMNGQTGKVDHLMRHGVFVCGTRVCQWFYDTELRKI